MTRFLLALPLLAAAGCATTPYAPVRDVSYQAMGGDPVWLLAIGDDRIVLRINDNPADSAQRPTVLAFPRTLPRTVDGVRTWRSGNVPRITVEARRRSCTGRGGQVFEDQVRVRWDTDQIEPSGIRDFSQELNGCGGRMLPREGTR